MINDIKLNRFNDLIKKEISKIITYEIKDPRLFHVYISYVKTNKNLQYSEVYFTSLINKDNNFCLSILNNAKNFFKYKLSKKLNTYSIPKIKFYIDKTIKNTIKIDKIFKTLSKDT